ncbi:hypothetical protein AMAG_00041 [Allomyces macrogynus ATCC 38327]|uniref:Uncharacterized protein n=1 Tax=Allomyces macrogynus (strain ATCC 38327) TaxID=578462 RepID=A0A0L0RUV2_ALLM3|nr:hypothetical protein AMAG_00041 [Allomyces macrogynus ATCC 38327]|eukprot:KNE54038.1 hypothetical protein AMAG_00041 [Allomyces macrogynus ATCC 38327]
MTVDDSIPVARLVLIGPAQAGKTQLIDFLASQDNDYRPLKPLIVGNGISACTEHAELHRLHIDSTVLQQDGLVRNRSPPHPLAHWIDVAEKTVDMTGEDLSCALLDVLDPPPGRFALVDAHASKSGRQRICLEIIDAPGIMGLANDLDPVHQQKVDDVLAKVDDIGGVHAVVVVVKEPVTLTSDLLDPLTSYLSPLSLDCKYVIVVHSHYFPHLAVERARPYLDISDHISAFDKWLHAQSFADNLLTMHVAMNNKLPEPKNAYPTQTAFCFQQLAQFLQVMQKLLIDVLGFSSIASRTTVRSIGALESDLAFFSARSLPYSRRPPLQWQPVRSESVPINMPSSPAHLLRTIDAPVRYPVIEERATYTIGIGVRDGFEASSPGWDDTTGFDNTKAMAEANTSVYCVVVKQGPMPPNGVVFKRPGFYARAATQPYMTVSIYASPNVPAAMRLLGVSECNLVGKIKIDLFDSGTVAMPSFLLELWYDGANEVLVRVTSETTGRTWMKYLRVAVDQDCPDVFNIAHQS